MQRPAKPFTPVRFRLQPPINNMKISIIGTGYVGLVTGSCLSHLGHKVTCLDIDEHKIQPLSEGICPIYEPGLELLIKKGLKNRNLNFTTSYKNACTATLIFLCIDTPEGKGGEPDLTNLKKVLRTLAKAARNNFVIATKSTVPIGTNSYISNFFKKNTHLNIQVISNPEFLKEGSAVKDFLKPDRVIIGCDSNRAARIMKKVYAPLNLIDQKVVFMSVASAELTKYAANSFLATKISFINKVAQISEKIGANIHEVKAGIGSDQRIGSQFLNAGLGYGGSCFPKDIQALHSLEKKFKLVNSLLAPVMKINDEQLEFFCNKIVRSLKKSKLHKTSLLIWGASFKPNTDDIRESIAIKLIKYFADKVEHIYLYDPISNKNASIELVNYKNISFCDSQYQSIEHSHALILCTEWESFQKPNLVKLKMLKDKKIFDGRNFLDKASIAKAGIDYTGIGL